MHPFDFSLPLYPNSLTQSIIFISLPLALKECQRGRQAEAATESKQADQQFIVAK